MKKTLSIIGIFIIPLLSTIFITSLNSKETKALAGEIINPQSQDSAEIIRKFSQTVNRKDYDTALELLDETIAASYSIENKAPLRNIENMTIYILADKTSTLQPDSKINLQSLYDYKVYYAEINYKTNKLTPSYLKDGVYNHKIVVIKEKKNSPWKIAEISSAPKQEFP